MTKPESLDVSSREMPLHRLGTVVVGSGAAALKCAIKLHAYGAEDVAIVTEKIGGGTSYNSGSDKQTYYKVSTASVEGDSPYTMAEALYGGGGMHGDIALTEAIGSLESFYELVSLGVEFPRNRYGGFVGYKTDHDPMQRGTSVGPYTSKRMVEALLAEVRRRNITIFDGFEVVRLLESDGRVFGALAIDGSQADNQVFGLNIFLCDNVVFGVGGPGGIYETAVYPTGHNGAIGLALEIGAEAANLTESQYGLASTGFRWNVSGSYQQCIPRYVTESGEFLHHYFPSVRSLAGAVFRKGYQWPFDPRKIKDHGSSLIDVLVYLETRVKNNRVFMDFTDNFRETGRIGTFSLKDLDDETAEYLRKSEALQKTPIERLKAINSAAISLYADHDIDITTEPLEIAVCAQHANGGLAGDVWWRSTNIAGLYPVGEVNGTHGVYRPGGSALNSGQVGGERAARWIAYGPKPEPLSPQDTTALAQAAATTFLQTATHLLDVGAKGVSVEDYQKGFQRRMSSDGAHIRDRNRIATAVSEASRQVRHFDAVGVSSKKDLAGAFRARHLAVAHLAYLEAIRFYLESGGGSRGSYLVLSEDGEMPPDGLPQDWRIKPENVELKDYLVVTVRQPDGSFSTRLEKRRPIPREEYWFEKVWQAYREGAIYA